MALPPCHFILTHSGDGDSDRRAAALKRPSVAIQKVPWYPSSLRGEWARRDYFSTIDDRSPIFVFRPSVLGRCAVSILHRVSGGDDEPAANGGDGRVLRDTTRRSRDRRDPLWRVRKGAGSGA